LRADPITDPRLRILALVGLAFVFSSLESRPALILMALMTAALVWLARLPWRVLLARLRLPGLVVAGIVLLLPLTSGQDVLARLGPLSIRAEGLAAATAIAARFLAIMTLVAVFLANLPLARIVAALRGLGLPDLLVDLALLTLRHISDLRHDLARMQVAMRLRGATTTGHRWRATGWIMASLLLRSHARSERIYQAMILRGHGAGDAAPPEFAQVTAADKAMLAAIFTLAAILVAVDYLA
jgi:cobalt/nickel transport system permease protein